MDTSRLIAELSNHADPVRRLPSPWVRTLLWLALAIPPVIIVVWFYGVDVDLATVLADRRFVIEQTSTFVTALAAAVAALHSTIPGRSRKWYWLLLVPLTVWLATVGAGCFLDWRATGPAALELRLDNDCVSAAILVGIVPAVTIVGMLRKGAPLSPRLTLVLGALATAGIVSFALGFFHIGDVSIMVLVWQFGLVAVLSACAGLVAPRFLGWSQIVDRPVAAIHTS